MIIILYPIGIFKTHPTQVIIAIVEDTTLSKTLFKLNIYRKHS